MSPLLLIALVVIALLITARSARRAWSDHHSVKEHHKALDTLGEMVQGQKRDSSQSPTDRAHVRVVPVSGGLPTQPPRWPAPPRWMTPAAPEGQHAAAPTANPFLLEPLANPLDPLQPAPAAPPASPALPVIPDPPGVPPLAPAASRATPPESATASPPPISAAWEDAESGDSVVVLRGSSTPAAPSPPPPPPPTIPVPASAERPPLVFDDFGSYEPVVTGPIPTLVPAGGPAPVRPRLHLTPPAESPAAVSGQAHPLPVPPLRPRRGSHARRSHLSRGAVMTGAGVAAVIALVLGLVVVLGGRSGRATHRLAPVAKPAPQQPGPATTLPPVVSSPVELISSDSQGATFSLTSSASIELVSSARCWVEVRAGDATGQVTYTATMMPGDRHALPVGGTVWVRLGNPPGVSIVINGTPLQAPIPSTAQPYNLQFQPARTGG